MSSISEAVAEIYGEQDKHLNAGSTLKLTCALKQSTEPPVFMFWYHGKRMINYDNHRGITVTHQPYESVLTIAKTRKQHSGNYTCVPSNAKSATVSVHIIVGKFTIRYCFSSHFGTKPSKKK